MEGFLNGLLKKINEQSCESSSRSTSGVATPRRHNKIAGFCLGDVCEPGFIMIYFYSGNYGIVIAKYLFSHSSRYMTNGTYNTLKGIP